MHTLFLKPEEIPFDKNSFGKYLKMSSRSGNLQPVLESANNLHRKYIHLASPAVKYSVSKILRTDQQQRLVFLEKDVIFSGRGISRLLSQSSQAVIYCLTIGKSLEETISELQIKDFYEAYLLDCIASTLLTGLQEIFSKHVLRKAEIMDKKLTKRFSPGYAGWNLNEQKNLFSVLNPGDIGIFLNEDSYMIPQKSVSGVYGLY